MVVTELIHGSGRESASLRRWPFRLGGRAHATHPQRIPSHQGNPMTRTTALLVPLGFTCALAAGCDKFSEQLRPAAPEAPAPPPASAAPLASSQAPQETPSPDASKDGLRLVGSNTIGAALAPKLVKAFLEKRGATSVSIDESARKSARITVVGTLGGKPISVSIMAPGSKHGFESLASGAADIAMASRGIKDEESDKLKALGDMTSPACETILGEDGIAIIVSPSSKVSKLSMKDLASVFDGTVQDWSKVGGSAGAIHVYSRDAESGTYDGFMSTVLHGKPMRSDVAGSFADSEALSTAVAKDPGGIGFVGLPYVKSAKAIATFEGDAAPLYPTVFTVATEDYALTRRLRLYSAEKPANPLARPFIDFALSDEGQAIVEDAGFVSLRVRAESPTIPANAPEKYSKEVQNATRLSVDFRFKTGKASLDNKALKDLDRVVAFLSSSKQRGKRAVLFGFADNQGNDPTNVELSKRRAESVQKELKARGVAVDTLVGLGSALPLASNDSPDGRERNRRVEIWVK
jgi:phosphate transport system substrate-binding protein